MSEGAEHLEADAVAFGARIRSMRTGAGLTLREVAARAGVSKSLLSQVERGSAQPSLITIRRLALALGVSAAAFFVDHGDEDDHAPDGTRLVIRAAERLGVVVRGGSAHWQVLVPNLDGNLLVLHGRLDAGGVASGPRQAADDHGEECLVCLEGELVCESGGRSHVLHAGDAITFVTGRAERLVNRGPVPALFLVASCR